MFTEEDQELLNVVVTNMAKTYLEICPCKDCEKRNSTCHSSCEEYRRWQENGVQQERKPISNFKRFTKKDFLKRERAMNKNNTEKL